MVFQILLLPNRKNARIEILYFDGGNCFPKIRAYLWARQMRAHYFPYSFADYTIRIVEM